MLQYQTIMLDEDNEKMEFINFLVKAMYILGQMGRYVAWAGSGSQTAGANG